MPNMQRLTWKGVALHAGKLPGHLASHYFFTLLRRTPAPFFGATKFG